MKEEILGKWTFAKDWEETFLNDMYDTKEEAIAAAWEMYGPDPYFKHIQVGRAIEPNVYVDGEHVVEQVYENVADQVGDIAEGWMSSMGRSKTDELSERLTAVFKEWMKEHHAEPHFYAIGDIEEIQTPAGKRMETDLYEQAKYLVIKNQQATITSVQLKLRLGYNDAARMIDQMEEEGIVGPYRGRTPREILIER